MKIYYRHYENIYILIVFKLFNPGQILFLFSTKLNKIILLLIKVKTTFNLSFL